MQEMSLAGRMRLEAGLPILRKKAAHNTAQNSPKATKTDANDADNNLSTSRPKHGSVGVLVVEDGCILSGIRKSGFAHGLVCGPGGHVEDGETHEQAAIRETQEEFGITPKGLIQIGLGPWEPDTGLKPAVFLTTEYEGTLRNTDGEMGDLRFRSLAELREMDKAMFQPFADAIDLMLGMLGRGHFDGGPGSGNYNHKGRPGQRGGSTGNGSTPQASGSSSGSSAASSTPKASDFKGGTGDFEVTGDVADLHLTSTAKAKVKSATQKIHTANDLKTCLKDKGIDMVVDYEPLQDNMDKEIASVKQQADYVAAAIEQYEELGGLSSLKAVHIYDPNLDAQAQYSYRATGEGDVDDEGHLYISDRANGFQIMHEFAHAYADSTKPEGMDVVEWSAKLNKEAGLSDSQGAYTGASSSAKEAERFADAVGSALCYGEGNAQRLTFLSNVVGIVKENSRSDGGPGSGNHNHKGVPGQRGGSAPSDGGSSSTSSESKSEKSAESKSEEEDKYLSPKAYVEKTMKGKGYTQEDIDEVAKIFDRHTAGYGVQEEADAEIAEHIASQDKIGKYLTDKADMEEDSWYKEIEEEYQRDVKHYEWEVKSIERDRNDPDGVYKNFTDEELRDYGIWPKEPVRQNPRFYRKGGMDKDVLAFSTSEDGANMSPITQGESGAIGYDVAYTLDEMKSMGYRPIAGITSMDVGYSGECEVLFARFPGENGDSRSDSLMSASDLATAFNSAISKNKDNEQKYLDKYLKSDIIKLRTQSTITEAFQALSPEDIAFIAEEFGVDVSGATEGKLQVVMAMLRMDGGPGSGNHGHKGVKGQRGGSAPSDSGSSSASNGSKGEKAKEKKSAGASASVSFGTATTKHFAESVADAKASVAKQHPEIAWRVTAHTQEELEADYPGAKLHVTDGGSTAAVTADGDIISVCKKPGDTASGRDILALAVENGGTKLDSYSGNHGFYVKCGFEPVSWCQWDDECAPSDWDTSKNCEREPVIFYKYTGNKNGSQSAEDFFSSTPASADYEAAQKARDDSIGG